jgi:hypothetical protein
MSYRLVVVLLSLPCVVLLPFFVSDAHRWFDEPGSCTFGRAVAGMVVTIAILEHGLRFAGELWQEETRKWPPGRPLPKPDPAAVFWWAVVVLVQVMALGTFLTTMDGGLRWAVARWVYLGYAVPALALAAGRWRRRWTWPELPPLGVGARPRLRRSPGVAEAPGGRAGHQPLGRRG